MLNRIVTGDDHLPKLIIAHGLYGSARNWGVIAKRLSDIRQVIAVDMRNHGDSPWDHTHSYEAMAADLAEVIEAHGGPVDLLGHSMGGKAAMMMALTDPQPVRHLIVADIAPMAYGHSQIEFVRAMQAVTLEGITRRSEVEPQLQHSVADPALRAFFLQSLAIEDGRARWKLNLDVLADQMPLIMGFPDVTGVFQGDVHFITGAVSDYVNQAGRERIAELFPRAGITQIEGAGHWVHAENPRGFEAALREVLT